MMKTNFVLALLALMMLTGISAKGGGGRGGGSRGSSSRGSSSSGSSWFSWGKSSPAASPSYKSSSSQSTGGAPPAYPGLQNRPVHNSHLPPAYSAGTHNYQPPNYGTQFGRSGVGSNTYIHNNYYGGGYYYGRGSSGSNFLTYALIFSAGRHHGYSMGHPVNYGSGSRSWSEQEDREWRETTQAPYFENKVPGGESVLPAAAVIGAATAFGLTTLLPLNVPAGKPLMYCNSTFIEQNPIKLGNNTYSCMNESIAISCLRTDENGISVNECLAMDRTLDCDRLEETRTVYCTKSTLASRLSIICKSTLEFNFTVFVNETSINETETVLNCEFGDLPESQASFIPTTTTEAPVTTTTEKPLSIEAQMHIFFLHLLGKSEVLETTTPEPTTTEKAPEHIWIPEAMTIPPATSEPSTTERTTTEPWYWARRSFKLYKNGTIVNAFERLPPSMEETHNIIYNLNPDDISTLGSLVTQVPRSYFDTTTSKPEITESTSESSTAKGGDRKSSTATADNPVDMFDFAVLLET